MEDRRSVGASSCNSGDGTDQRVQSLMFMMMTNMSAICLLRDTFWYSNSSFTTETYQMILFCVITHLNARNKYYYKQHDRNNT